MGRKHKVGSIVPKYKTCYKVTKVYHENYRGTKKLRYEIQCIKCNGVLVSSDRVFPVDARGLKNPKSYCCPCAKNFSGWTEEERKSNIEKSLPQGSIVLSFPDRLTEKGYIKVYCKGCKEEISVQIMTVSQDKFVCGCNRKSWNYNRQEEEKVIKTSLKDGYSFGKWECEGGTTRKDKFSIICKEGHKKVVSVDQFRSKRKTTLLCTRCDSQSLRRYNKDYENTILKICESQGYRFLGWESIKFRHTIHSKFKWKCWCGNLNSTSFDNFTRDRGCKECSSKTRNYTGTGYLYLSEWSTTLNYPILKVGITKLRRPIKRVRQFAGNSGILKGRKL